MSLSSFWYLDCIIDNHSVEILNEWDYESINIHEETAGIVLYVYNGSTASSAASAYVITNRNISEYEAPDTYWINYYLIYEPGNTDPYNLQKKEYNVPVYLIRDKPIREGFIFTGWTATANGKYTEYEPGAAYTANEGITLYAVWKCDGHDYAAGKCTKCVEDLYII